MTSTKDTRREIAALLHAELGGDGQIVTLPYLPGNLTTLPAVFVMPSSGDGGYITKSGGADWCTPVTSFEVHCCTRAGNAEGDFDQLDDWADALIALFGQNTVRLDDGRTVRASDVTAGNLKVGDTDLFAISADLTVSG